jgi:hypothetical protein
MFTADFAKANSAPPYFLGLFAPSGNCCPHCIFSTGILNEWYSLQRFISDLEAVPERCIAVFTAHGFRCLQQWQLFTDIVDYVARGNFETIQMRDLPMRAYAELKSLDSV